MKLYHFLAIFLFVIACQAKDINGKVDSIFSKWNNIRSPGCAVAIIKNQKVVYEKGFGSASLEYKIPITPKTVFAVASISKQFTAFAIALLLERGKINLNDRISEYIPRLSKPLSRITIKDLIYHTDGLRDQWDLLTFSGWNLYTDAVSNKNVLSLIKMQQNLNFTPGTEYLYGNSGYTLLAEIVEKTSGENFLTFCKNNIFKPLGMNHTFFNNNYKRVINDLAYSYKPSHDGFLKSPYNISTYGATGLYTTVEDMVKWNNNFYSHKLGGGKLISLISTPGKLNSGKILNYGFGLEIKKYKQNPYIGHSGGDAGYNTFFMTFPNRHLSIIILANLKSINARKLAFKVADIFFNEDNFKTSNKETVKVQVNRRCEYKKLTGYYYSKKAGTDLKISNQNKCLYVKLMDKKLELKNIINNEFVLVLFPTVSLKFEKEKNAYRLLYKNNLQDLSFTLDKVNKDNLAIGDLNKYKGSYICPELNITYRIKFINDKLVLLRPRFVKSSMIPIFKDFFKASNGFLDFPYGIKFIRDSKDEIIGFNISTSIVTNRVRKLFFRRE